MTVLPAAESGPTRCVTVTAPPNIALVKYWGKRNEELMLPANDSVSLSIDAFAATTTLEAKPLNGADRVLVNGVEKNCGEGTRYAKVFAETRRLLRKRRFSSDESGSSSGDGENGRRSPLSASWSFQISSSTNFPVAAGLASSAAGFAAIAFALGRAFDLTDSDVSRLARIGSGSACRSVFGGLVRWFRGQKENGIDCRSESVGSDWDSLRAVLVVVEDAEKEVGSTEGMKKTVETSELFQERLRVVQQRADRVVEAYGRRDFAALAADVIRDSNQMHACCMDTTPPLMYMNGTSFAIIRLLSKFNKDGYRAAYTYDAGPNACVFVQEQDVSDLVAEILKTFRVPEEVAERLRKEGYEVPPEHSTRSPIKNIVISTVGAGPKVLGM